MQTRIGIRTALALVLTHGALVPGAAAQPASHVMRSGETLFGIAQRFGLSEAQLRALNPDIEDPTRIQVGQRVALRASGEHAGQRRGERPAAPREDRTLTMLLRTPGVASRRWTAIVVHHSATSTGSVAQFDHYHRDVRGFPRGMAYHFVIGNGHGLGDGEIDVGPRWRHQHPGAHVASAIRDPQSNQALDDVAIGVVLVGNFEETRPSAAQRRALDRLIHHLQRRYHIPADHIMGHGEVGGAHTACPGRRLAMDRVRGE